MSLPGVDLEKAVKTANEAVTKLATARFVEYLKSLKVQSHNLLVKETRLRTEAEQATAARSVIEDRIKKIESGDWSAVELDKLEMAGVGVKPEKTE